MKEFNQNNTSPLIFHKEMLLNWANEQLSRKSYQPIQDVKELKDGSSLLHLFSIISQIQENDILKGDKSKNEILIEYLKAVNYQFYLCSPDDIEKGFEEEILAFLTGLYLWYNQKKKKSK
eukprot:Anaeramoba_ignava/c18238_g1_i3.p2 GENE.c18238_g1_i3~~c18238_g1_i3.p2  ORF type:complete len:120 (-),score=40.57 c18238_g1_i3:3080-3439(-)